MPASFDQSVADSIAQEFEGIFGTKPDVPGNKPEGEGGHTPIIKPKPLPDLKAPDTWPRSLMFSEVYNVPVEDGFMNIKRLGKVRDIPVPMFEPEDWPAEAQPMIPKPFTPWRHNLATAYGIALALFTGDTTLVHGPTGCGKTSPIYMAGAVHCIPVWLTSVYAEMEDTGFLGSTGLRPDPATGANTTEYVPSQLVLSLMHGGICVLDEAFRRGLMPVQSLLEETHRLVLADADGLSAAERVLHPEPGKWWIILTDNTTGTGDHTGNYNAQVQDVSSLDRVLQVVAADYLDRTSELEILGDGFPDVPGNIASDIVSMAAEVRGYFKAGGLLQTMSTRATLSIAKKYVIMGSFRAAVESAFAGKLDPESRAKFAEVYHQITGEELD